MEKLDLHIYVEREKTLILWTDPHIVERLSLSNYEETRLLILQRDQASHIVEILDLSGTWCITRILYTMEKPDRSYGFEPESAT